MQFGPDLAIRFIGTCDLNPRARWQRSTAASGLAESSAARMRSLKSSPQVIISSGDAICTKREVVDKEDRPQDIKDEAAMSFFGGEEGDADRSQG